MTPETLQRRVTAATERNLVQAAALVDNYLEKLSGKWASLAAETWSARIAISAGSLTTASAYDAAAKLTRQGVADAQAELQIISDAAASTVARVVGPAPDTPALRLLGSQLAERLHPGPGPEGAPEWLGANEWQAARIVDTEAMRGYSAGREAVMRALKEAGDGADYKVRRDWAPVILMRWNALMDKRLCPVCSALDGQVRPLLASFGTPSPPTHPRCRCALQFWPLAIPD